MTYNPLNKRVIYIIALVYADLWWCQITGALFCPLVGAYADKIAVLGLSDGDITTLQTLRTVCLGPC